MIAQQLYDLFQGNEKARGFFNPSSEKAPGKVQGTARILREGPTVKHWEEHLAGHNGLGVIPIRSDNTCVWAAIDVDKYDVNHEQLSKTLSERNIPGVVGRSKSGGAHVYFFFKEAISAADIQAKLTEIAASLGYAGSELFPKQTELLEERGDTGNFLNMPYYAGDRTVRYGYDSNGETLSVDEFIRHCHDKRKSRNDFLSLKAGVKFNDAFKDGPPCLQLLSKEGFGEGSRNNALYSLGVFRRMADPENWEALLMKDNADLIKPPLSTSEVNTVVKSLTRKEGYFYKCGDQPIRDYCNKAVCSTRKYGIGKGGDTSLTGLIKIEGHPPIWMVTVDGKRVSLETEDLQNQKMFQKVCLEQISIRTAIIKPNLWESKMEALMENLSIVEASPDATKRGIFLELLKEFASNRAKGTEYSDLAHHIPVWLDGMVYTRIAALSWFIRNNEADIKFTRTQLYELCKELGGGSKELDGQHVVYVPQSLFSEHSDSNVVSFTPREPKNEDII